MALKCQFNRSSIGVTKRIVKPTSTHSTSTQSSPMAQAKAKWLCNGRGAILLCALAEVPQASTHILLGGNHKAIGGVYRRVEAVFAQDAVAEERKIQFGQKRKWQEVEGDEATFQTEVLLGDTLREQQEKERLVPAQTVKTISTAQSMQAKKTVPTKWTKKRVKNTRWEQWVGLVARGLPRSLVLSRLPTKLTTQRSPGPGPIKNIDWKPLGRKHLEGKCILFHTDKARAYRLKLKKVLHDVVVHKKKKAARKGNTVWLRPKFVEMKTHDLPDGRRITVKTGTQVIDRAWRFIKDRLKHCNAGPGSLLLQTKVRATQWRYWNRGSDLWLRMADALERLRA